MKLPYTCPCPTPIKPATSSVRFCDCFWYHDGNCLTDNGIEAGLEPLDGVVAVDLVLGTDLGLATAATADALTGAGHADVEVHAVDTDTGVVLDAEIDVLGDTETEVAGLGEVALAQLILLDLEATLENLLSLGATDGDVDGNLFVTTDTEGTDGVTGLACWRGRGLALGVWRGAESERNVL